MQTKLVSVIVWASCVKLRASWLKCHLHGVTSVWLFGHHVSSLEHHGSSATCMVSLRCDYLDIMCHPLSKPCLVVFFQQGKKQFKKPGQVCGIFFTMCKKFTRQPGQALHANFWVHFFALVAMTCLKSMQHAHKNWWRKAPKNPLHQTSAKPGLPKICLPGTPPPNLEICLPGPPKFWTPSSLEDKFWVHLLLSSRTWPDPRRQIECFVFPQTPEDKFFCRKEA